LDFLDDGKKINPMINISSEFIIEHILKEDLFVVQISFLFLVEDVE
jgi:hypothetical protein